MGQTASSSAQTTKGIMQQAEIKLNLSQVIDVEEVIKIAQEAGKVIKEIYMQKTDDWEVQAKSDDSPLTKADQAANQVICDSLQRITPHIPIISEENKNSPYSTRKFYQYAWCVDPLDGTKEFIKRNGQFTVNIALLRANTPVLGVVHAPILETTHWALVGKGAYVRKSDQPEKKLTAEKFNMSDSGLSVVASASHMSQDTKDFLVQLKNPQFAQMGSSLKLLMVAEGAAHVYPRMAPTCEWDTAASHIIVTEAGGKVVQAGKCDNKGKALENWKEALAKQDPIQYNKEDFLNPYFVVYGNVQDLPAPSQ